MDILFPPKIKSAIFASSLLAIGSSQASVVAVNFATEHETGPTDALYYYGIYEVPADGWQNFAGESSGGAATLNAGTVNLDFYWDSSDTLFNPNMATTSPYHGYLNDGPYKEGADTGWVIQISGLSSWMAANGSSEWGLALLLASDNTGDYRGGSIHTGTVEELISVGETSGPSAPWLTDPADVDNWPNGGTAGFVLAPYPGGAISTGGNTSYTSTRMFAGNTDAFILRDLTPGIQLNGRAGVTTRASIAGFMLYTVPEPGTSLVAGMALCGLALRRRR